MRGFELGAWRGSALAVYQPLGKQFGAHTAFVLSGSLRTTLVGVDQIPVVQTDQVQDRGMQIMDMQAVFDRMQSDLIGATDRLTASDSATGHPHRKAVGIVVASVPFFAHRCASELTTPDHQGRIE